METSPKLTIEERLRWRKKTCGIMLLAWVLAAFKNGFLENGFQGYFLDPFWSALGEMVGIAMIAALPAFIVWLPFSRTVSFSALWAAVVTLWYACSLALSLLK